MTLPRAPWPDHGRHNYLRKGTKVKDYLLSRAKAIVAAVVAAVVTALAGVDWYEVIASAAAAGVGVERIPNRRKRS